MNSAAAGLRLELQHGSSLRGVDRIVEKRRNEESRSIVLKGQGELKGTKEL